MKFITKSLNDTKKLALAFYNSIGKDGLFVTLTGDIGTGKTQFIRYVSEFMEVKSKVTSPSFVILNEYKSKIMPIYHFDLYRLEEKGLKSVTEELREYSKKGVLTFVEWADFGLNEIPENSLKINVEYDKNNIDIRTFEFTSYSIEYQKFLEKLLKEMKK